MFKFAVYQLLIKQK